MASVQFIGVCGRKVRVKSGILIVDKNLNYIVVRHSVLDLQFIGQLQNITLYSGDVMYESSKKGNSYVSKSGYITFDSINVGKRSLERIEDAIRTGGVTRDKILSELVGLS